MIFLPALARAILTGQKTQTRRLVQSGDLATKWRPGMRRCVQKGSNQPGEFHIMLTQVRRERLGDISFEDVRAEGHRTSEDFKESWVEERDAVWLSGVPILEDSIWGAVVLERFKVRWANHEVWVLTFRVDRTEVPRFLSARPCPDYTTNPHRAATGEPEALSIADHKRYVQDRAEMTAEQYRELERATRDRGRELASLEQRMVAARRDAALGGISITSELRVIEKRVKAIERRVDGRAA